MTCIKTGAQVYLEQYSIYMICDIHQFSNGMWVLRGSDQTLRPTRSKLHAVIHNVAQDWQPANATSTMVVEYCDYKYHGYDGISIEEHSNG